MSKNVYVYYCGATDKTGAALAEALNADHGKNAPGPGKKKVVIGWGAKTKDDINLGNCFVLNHPNAIRSNRNKFQALELMAAAKVNVAPFVSADGVLKALDDKKNKITLPLIARTNYHQGGKMLWPCLVKSHVQDVINILNSQVKKKGYFQNYLDVDVEYRLHVVQGQLIYAQKKVPRSNIESAYVKQEGDKIKRIAEKNGKDLDEDTLQYALQYQGKRIDSQDLITKSNSRGYKFSSVKLESVPKSLAAEAVKAVAALKLDFAAVDCVIDAEKKPWIIEANTGPGLDGTSFKKYAEAFNTIVNEALAPPKKPKPADKSAARASSGSKSAQKKSSGKLDPEKLRTIADMLETANENEKDAIHAVASRMFGD